MSDYPAAIDLALLDGEDGVILTGGVYTANIGAGDFNHDGYSDLIVGGTSNTAFVVFGGPSLPASLRSSDLDGSNGFQIINAAVPRGSWLDVSGVGDVNGDGIEDFGIVAQDGPPRGNAFILFGHEGVGPAVLDFGDLSTFDDVVLSHLPSSDTGKRYPLSTISSAGDVNGDGVDDMLLGAVGRTHAGSAFVVFGKAGGFADGIDVKALGGTDGFRIDGARRGSLIGTATSSTDINGDGLSDVIVASGPRGETFVVFGSDGGFAPTLNVSTLNGSSGFKVIGPVGDRTGYAVSGGGDVNGDGIDDALFSNRTGDAFVLFGKTDGFSATVDLNALDGISGFKIHSPDKPSDVSVAGDFNGDGFGDLLVTNDSGAYLVFGAASPRAEGIDLAALDGSNGIRFILPTQPSFEVTATAAGDVNGDGLADIIIGAGQSAYVVYGRLPGEAVERTGTEIGQTIHGGQFDDAIRALGGDDVVFGHGGSDRLYGNEGLDRLFGGGGADTLIGGFGGDLLTGGGGADTFIYRLLEGSRPGAADRIRDFNRLEGDLIDLARIDADVTLDGNQAFHIGGSSFSMVAGELIQFAEGQGRTILQGDVDGDGVADFEIAFGHAPTLLATDFLL